MPVPTSSLKAIIVGAGPVACLVALELRKRSIHVEVYEKGADFRHAAPTRNHSFNLTLSRRALGALDQELTRLVYDNGIPLSQRVIHHADGSISYQQYGMTPDEHLLCIPRETLHRILLTEAERAGVRMHFHHRCIGTEPEQGGATFTVGNSIHRSRGDLLIGCDGANSIVRHEMARSGARMRLAQDYIDHGYAELTVPPAENGEHALLRALRDPAQPASYHHGQHVWPRGDFMVLAQPNVNRGYTTSLFMPLDHAGGQPSFRSMRTPEAIEAIFSRHFPDLAGLLPDAAHDLLNAPPASLKTVTCFPYHHERAVLIGDSAHTMVPFFGQGINCSFEDVRSFTTILDQHLNTGDAAEAVRTALAEFTEERKAPGDAITALSMAHFEELTSRTGENGYHSRDALERKLHEHHPDTFIPLYHMVAFTDIPYHQVVQRHERQKQLVDELCQRYDVTTELPRIVEAYSARRARFLRLT